MNRHVKEYLKTPSSIAMTGALGFASSPAFARQAVQWRTQDGGNGHWYARIDEQCTWPEARTRCEARGGYLATPTSAPEDSIVAQLNSGANAFLGGIRSGGSGPFTWITGEAWAYTNWLPGEPNCSCEPYLHYWLNSSRWNDMHAPFRSVFICEWSADCDGNGLVDYGEILEGTVPDTNGNGVPDCCDAGVSCDPCPADLNDTNTIDAEDLAFVLFAWGTDGGKTPEADINHDGTVDATDLSVVLSSWGACPD